MLDWREWRHRQRKLICLDKVPPEQPPAEKPTPTHRPASLSCHVPLFALFDPDSRWRSRSNRTRLMRKVSHKLQEGSSRFWDAESF